MDKDFENWIKVDKLKPTYTLNDTEREGVYKDFVDLQKKHFESYINFLNAELCTLKHYGIVSDFTKFLARIKSVESSVKNDKIKALNDVFGIEIDSATPGEVNFIVTLFSDTLARTREVVHNKENKYVAHHYSGYPKAGNIVTKLEEMFDTTYEPISMFEEYIEHIPIKVKEQMSEGDIDKLKSYFDNFCVDLNEYTTVIKRTVNGDKLKELKKDLRKIEKEYHKIEKLKDGDNYHQPIIEGQFKTIQTAIEANIGCASHGKYKGEDMKTIQKEYDQRGGIPLSRLPVMYRSNLETDENNNPIPPKILSSDETAKALYPSLIVKKKGERGVNK